MGMKVGVCGCGAFASCFIPLFKAHPGVDEVALADALPERARDAAEKFEIERTFDSLDALCRSDVDAVALFTQRQLHGPQAIQALKAGKHVYSAVPAAMSLDDLGELVELVERTGLLYATGETSYYYPATIYCRRRFQAGDFGKFVYGEAQYLHDMDHFYGSFRRSGGEQWRRVAGLPPMYYPTHSLSMIICCTGARATHVSCLGYRDTHEDEIFRAGNNDWDNVFSNESALMRTSDGGVMRINEMRRIGYYGGTSVYMSLFGELGSFEQNAVASCWLTKERAGLADLTEALTCGRMAREDTTEVASQLDTEFYEGVSSVHPIDRLPDSFRGHSNGHLGSHQFLVDDYVTAWTNGTLPPCHVWNSAKWMAPGIVAHESAKRDGEMLEVPDFGEPPA